VLTVAAFLRVCFPWILRVGTLRGAGLIGLILLLRWLALEPFRDNVRFRVASPSLGAGRM